LTAPLAIDSEITCCSFYDGTIAAYQDHLSYRPNAYFEFLPSYEGTFISLPSGDVDIHLLALEAIVNFIPDMSLDVQGQYDNISASFPFLGAIAGNMNGHELFVSLGQGPSLRRDVLFAAAFRGAALAFFGAAGPYLPLLDIMRNTTRKPHRAMARQTTLRRAATNGPW